MGLKPIYLLVLVKGKLKLISTDIIKIFVVQAKCTYFNEGYCLEAFETEISMHLVPP